LFLLSVTPYSASLLCITPLSLGVFSRWQIGGETVNNSPFHMNGDVAEIVVFTRSLSQVWPSVETIT
jgi:hypothetical protein